MAGGFAVFVGGFDIDAFEPLVRWPAFISENLIDAWLLMKLWVDGELIGGCDIVCDMDETGELREVIVGESDSES